MTKAIKCKNLQLRMLLLQFSIISVSIWGPVNVQSAPLKVTLATLKNCIPGYVLLTPTSCCPTPDINLNVSVVDFIPKRDRVKVQRVRKALQCLSGEELRIYTRKLTRAYKLMRALPPSDPRSFLQQNRVHCAYSSGSFIQDSLSAAGNFTYDIHFSWLFLPWHRLFVYFHERILQKLLNDPTFSLHFWNFDNGVDGTEWYDSRHGKRKGCFKPGHFFPAIYNDNYTSTFEPNRSARVFTMNLPVDLTLPAPLNDSIVPLRFADVAAPKNTETVHVAMERGKISRDFFGITFRYGDVRPPNNTGGGSLEFQPHNSVHRWLGGLVSKVPTAPLDPIFYPFHANLERLWDVWMKLGDNRKLQPTDPDWLNVEFLFWDENSVLRRIKVRDSLNIGDLGYSFEKVNDESWIFWENSTSTTPITPATAPAQY